MSILRSDPFTVQTVENVPPPQWNQAPIADQQHALSVGQAVDIDLSALVDQADSFAIINSESDYNEPVLPAGLSLVGDRIQGIPMQAGAHVVRVRAIKGTRNPNTSWATRSAGAINTEDFEALDSVTSVSPFLSGNPDRSVRVTNVQRSGSASMRQFMEADENATANWLICTTDPTYDLSQNFGEHGRGFNIGDEFYFQFQIRPNRNFCKWRDWHEAQTSPKLTILDMLPPGGTSNNWESVLQNWGGYPKGYQNSLPNYQWESKWGAVSTACLGSDFRQVPDVDNGAGALNGVDPGLPSGNGVDQPWTACQQDRHRYSSLYSYANIGGWQDGLPDPIGGTNAFAPDEWHTILCRIKVGTPGLTDAECQVWLAHDGQPYELLADLLYAVNGDWRLPGEYDQPTVYEALWFTNFATGLDPTGKPETDYHIDEVIVSNNYIPEPDVGDGSSNYRTSDAFITLNISDVTAPSWFQSATESRWNQVPNANNWDAVRADQNGFPNLFNTFGLDSILTNAWNGMVARERYLTCAAHGGHTASNDGSVYQFGPLWGETPAWSRAIDPTPSPVPSTTPQADGKGISRHTYFEQAYDPVTRTLLSMQAGGTWDLGGTSSVTEGLVFSDEASATGGNWFVPAQADSFSTDLFGVLVYDPGDPSNPSRGGVQFCQVGSGPTQRGLQLYDPVQDSWSRPNPASNPSYSTADFGGWVDPIRRLFVVQRANEMCLFDINAQSSTFGTGVVITVSSPYPQGVGFDYEPESGEAYAYSQQQNLYRINLPANYRTGAATPDDPINPSMSAATFTTIAPVAGGTNPGNAGQGNVYSNFRYMRQADGSGMFVVYLSNAAGCHFWKIPPGGIP